MSIGPCPGMYKSFNILAFSRPDCDTGNRMLTVDDYKSLGYSKTRTPKLKSSELILDRRISVVPKLQQDMYKNEKVL